MRPDDDKTQTHTVLAKGTLVGHYRIVEKIGAGGMGEVYLAEDTKLGREIALKFLPQSLVADQEAKARFTREARAAAALKHPNIVTIHEVSEFQGRPFFAMECCEGQSLRDMIAGEKLTIDRIIDLTIQIGEGLQEAHEAGIVHRDIKPSNIMLDKKGRPKLADFGLAAIQGMEKLTKTGSTLGTIGYMSPEQIQVKTVDRRSDLFSLGVLLYEMITGRLPFKGDTEAAVMNSVLHDTPEPLSRYKSGVSGELEWIVSKLLEKDPALRYQSAEGVISDLKRLSIPAASDEKPRKDWWNRYVVPAAVVILLAMIVYWYRTFNVNRQADVAPAEKIMLAVLPFENVGNPEDESFADGITDEIIVRLGSVSGLGVITRSSTMSYKDSRKSLKQIARELKVDYIVSGTIRWQKSGESFNRIKVSPRLIEPSSGVELWASAYDDTLTEIFSVQSNIAGHIAGALNITLQAPEQRLLDYVPTKNMEAYAYYRRGMELYESTWAQWPDAENMLQAAIALDSDFALAFAQLSRFHSFQFWYELGATPENRQKAFDLATRALEIDPALPEGHLAMGYYHYYCRRDFAKALEEFEIARQGRPSSGDVLEALHYIYRRKGKYEEALALGSEALRLDPLSFKKRTNLFATARNMRKFDEAARLADEGIILFPQDETFSCFKGLNKLFAKGDIAGARKALDEVPPDVRTVVWSDCFYIVHFAAGHYDSARACITTNPDTLTTLLDSARYYGLIAETYYFENDDVHGRPYFDSTRVCLETNRTRGIELWSQEPPSLGLVYAALGRKEDAITAVKEMVDLLPLSEDAYLGVAILENLAQTYTRVGEYDLALDQLEILLSIPSSMTTARLRIDPYFEPLRGHPRFKALLEKYEKEHAI